MAFTQFAWSRSRETLYTVKLFAPLLNFALLYLEYAATTLGFSIRQGMHQEAQKSMRTMLPRREESARSLPSGVLNFNSGAMLPTFKPSTGFGVCAMETVVAATAINSSIFFIIFFDFSRAV